MTHPPPACVGPAWHPVADRIANTPKSDTWRWRISWAERELLAAALDAGTATTAQQRAEGGAWVLLARAVPERRGVVPTGRRARV